MDKTLAIIEERYSGFEPGDRERIKKIIELAGTGGTLLDLGCGIGLIGRELIKKGNKVFPLSQSLISLILFNRVFHDPFPLINIFKTS